MWVVREIKKPGGRIIYRRIWRLSERTKYRLMVLCCYIIFIVMIVFAYWENWK